MKFFDESRKNPLAVCAVKGKSVLYSKILEVDKKTGVTSWQLIYNTSADGQTFLKRNNRACIYVGKKLLDIQWVQSMKIYAGDAFLMTIEIIDNENKPEVLSATSVDGKTWKVMGIVPIAVGKQSYVLPKKIFYSDKNIWVKTKLARKTPPLRGGVGGGVWSPSELVAQPRRDSFDTDLLRVVSVIHTPEGLVVIYDVESFPESSVNLFVGALILRDEVKGKQKHISKDISKIIWRSAHPLWEGRFGKTLHMTPLGSALIKKKQMYHLIVYWKDDTNQVISGSLTYPFTDRLPDKHIHKKIVGPLSRFHGNPVIAPRHAVGWEADGTFNPAAFMDDEGAVHLLYRAIGTDGISRIGYAHSTDGMHFSKRSAHPVFEPGRGFGMPSASARASARRGKNPLLKYNPLVYTSGGGWGGSEDPRTVKIRHTVYMLYMAFEGWNSMRMALTSIHIDDLQTHDWHWQKPVLISPPNQMNKNWLLFPEKVRGKYAILHSIAPKVLVDYVDDLDKFDGTYFIHSPRPNGPQPGRHGFWDNLLRGAGPPPLKTPQGWLLLYHAIDRRDPNRYKLGAMLLDLKDPTVVLYRTDEPLLASEMHYENEGKAGVIYASGAVIKDNKLFIYYGGGDRVVCVASAPLDVFLKHVKENKRADFSFTKINLD